MGLWGEAILPRIVDRALRTSEVSARRAQTLAGLRGEVLEIGFGSGLNLRHYPDGVSRVLRSSRPTWPGGWPSRGEVAVRRRSNGSAWTAPGCRCRTLRWTRWSPPSPCAPFRTSGRALAEIRRVLRPGGWLHFLEHGLAPEQSVRRWQRRLQPLQSRIVGGCRLDRRIDELVVGAGLQIGELVTGYGDGPKPFSYLYQGRAAAA